MQSTSAASPSVDHVLPVVGPSHIPSHISPIPPYNPKPRKESIRSTSQHEASRKPRASEGRVSKSPPAHHHDLEMGSLSPANPAATPSPSAPPRYDELPNRLDDFITPPEPTRARPSSGRRSGRNPAGRGRTSGTSESPATVLAYNNRHIPYLPPPPAFGVKQSPDTVSRSFFFYGFIFPLFWFMGSLVLVLKLHPIPEELCGKPPSEQGDQLLLLRATEEKWAYRCLAASIVFIVGLGVVIIVVIVVRSHS